MKGMKKMYFYDTVCNSCGIIMIPAVNDLHLETLRPTEDNGVPCKLTNPVVNWIPVQREIVWKLAFILNKISVLQATVCTVHNAVSFQVKILSPEGHLHNVFAWQRIILTLISPLLQNFPPFLHFPTESTAVSCWEWLFIC